MKKNIKKIDKALIVLNKGTVDETIKWKTVTLNNAPGLEGYEELNGNVYCCKHKGKRLCIYKYDTRYYVDEDAWYPSSSTRLLFINDDYAAEWCFPENRMINDLYSSVSYQIAQVDSFFDSCTEGFDDDYFESTDD
ncbi:hypothetical protein MHK_008414 [Candidatus Magnetomorum sp. HK-1]|nr:hypothetical protein MHK_008414 [Candidatus Magnetomorum sp. HK-1]